MTVRPIRLFGDPILSSNTETIDWSSPSAKELVTDLIDTVSVPGRAGVAANQIGVGLSAFSYNIDGTVGYLLNPRLLEAWGEQEEIAEACLSLPGLSFPRLRYPNARVEGYSLAGELVELEGHGLMAQALQHELDHLSGRLFFQGLPQEARKEALRQIRNADWFR